MFIGNLGSAKTLSLTHFMRLALNKKVNNIYTNYSTKFNKHLQERVKKLNSPVELFEIKTRNNHIFLDEIYLWFDCYDNDKETRKLQRNVINVSRKNDMTIYGTTQTLGQVNFKYRLLIDYAIYPTYIEEKIILKNGKKRTVRKVILNIYTVKSTINEAIIQEYLDTIIIKNPEKIFNWYDTNEVLVDFTNTQSQFKVQKQIGAF